LDDGNKQKTSSYLNFSKVSRNVLSWFEIRDHILSQPLFQPVRQVPYFALKTGFTEQALLPAMLVQGRQETGEKGVKGVSAD
jgi:hypothetical protein